MQRIHILISTARLFSVQPVALTAPSPLRDDYDRHD
jgi:hypothetical protein